MNADHACPPPDIDIESPRLWAVHIHGPDDMYAMPDRETAENTAREFNAFWASHRAEFGDTSRFRPVVRAHVELWPWSADGHAEDLARQAEDTATRTGDTR